jgi:hypothetical protein
LDSEGGMSRIRLDIGKLVLRGFAPGDREALAAGLKTELSRLLADPTTRAQWARSQRMLVMKLGRMPFTTGISQRLKP